MKMKKTNLRDRLVLEKGTLWKRLMERTEKAFQCGALQPIPTDFTFVEQGGIDFLVRVLSNIARKDEAKKTQKKQSITSGKAFNPFLPYEEALFVAHISDTHVCLLNKFNVVNHHLLIVTRVFEDQEILLTLQDFEAIWACLAEFEGLAFYNGGEAAGASQPHKHLQYVPLPLAEKGPKMPIEPVFEHVQFQKGPVGVTSDLPFVHAIVRFDPRWMMSLSEGAESMLQCYHNMLSAVKSENNPKDRGNRQAYPYNLLITRQWMLLVPRSKECFEAISINALGFAGALLVRNEEQMHLLKEQGPMTLLKSVAVSDDLP